MPSAPIDGRSAAPRIHALVLLSAAFILITMAAFAIGLAIGAKVDEATQQEGTSTDTSDGSGTDTPSAVGTISIDWLPSSKFEKVTYDQRLFSATVDESALVIESSAGLVVGTVTEGDYEGWRVVANILGRAELGTTYTTIFTLGSPDVDMSGQSTEYVVVADTVLRGYYAGSGDMTTFSELYPDADVPLVDVTLDGLVPPETLSIDGATFVRDSVGQNMVYPEKVDETDFSYVGNTAYGALRMIADDETFDQDFTGIRNAFFVVSPVGNVFWYDIDIPFWTSEDRRSGVPAVVIGDKTNTATYLKGSVGGCGYSDMTNVVTDVPALDRIGYAVGDDDVEIYEPRDWNDEMFDDEYATWSAMNEGGTREAFAALHALFFYQDATGRWIQFTKTDVVPPGECGKPVIYLYPQTTTDVTVRVAPKGGFSVTIPDYGNGWNVTASPDGTLTNKADGKTYPYLFWEGRGAGYAEPASYWVVAQSDVHRFLVSTLARLGLNEIESADFMEFWEPRMQQAPYYKIGFHGTEVMNLIAPVQLSTKADTLIRILMDFSELDAPIAAHPPVLPATPERDGFTVVEWGGVIR